MPATAPAADEAACRAAYDPLIAKYLGTGELVW